MKKISIINYKGIPQKADLVLAFTCENGKNYVAINNGDIVFSQNSAYNNLDILEVVKEDKDEYYVSNVLDEDWEAVQNTMINEFFSKIKSDF